MLIIQTHSPKVPTRNKVTVVLIISTHFSLLPHLRLRYELERDYCLLGKQFGDVDIAECVRAELWLDSLQTDYNP